MSGFVKREEHRYVFDGELFERDHSCVEAKRAYRPELVVVEEAGTVVEVQLKDIAQPDSDVASFLEWADMILAARRLLNVHGVHGPAFEVED